MNFKKICDLAYNIIDEIDEDSQIEIIVKNAINESYLELCKLDKRVTKAYIPIVRGMATLPTNCISVEKTTPRLSDGDKIVGNTIFSDKQGVFDITYSYQREPMVSDTDEPEVNPELHYAMVLYAAYRYYEHRKKDNVAQMFLNNYMTKLQTFNVGHSAVVESVIMEY